MYKIPLRFYVRLFYYKAEYLNGSVDVSPRLYLSKFLSLKRCKQGEKGKSCACNIPLLMGDDCPLMADDLFSFLGNMLLITIVKSKQ